MADATAAERQRRYRAHKRGDHSLCPPDRPDCAAVTSGETRNAVTVTPELGKRGRLLWTELAEGDAELRPGERVLVEEACRLADRLDVLDRLLRGDDDAWVRLHSVNEDGSIVKVVLNNALAEARQQQIALKQLLAELRQSRAGGTLPQTPGARPPAPKEGAGDDRTGASGVVSLAARLAAKRGGPAAG